jgi:hypothetical protein
MPGPIAAAGAISNPTRYGALTMGAEQFTGLYTQRSPYRDAATPYLVKKFYQGSRFDSILDGINREITAKLTDGRRPGSVVYNTTSIDRILSFYSFKYIVGGIEQVHVIVDKASDVEDATASGRFTIFLKSAGAGRTRFLGLGPTLYMSDGIDAQKWVRSSTAWTALTAISPGTLIVVDPADNLQMALGGITMNILATSSNGTVTTIYFDTQTVTNQFANLQGVNVTFSGLTTAGVYLNGNTYSLSIVSSTLGIATVTVAHAIYALTNDTGSGTTGNGTTGAVAPTWLTTQFAITADAGQQWKCYGPALEGWGLAAPTMAPVVTPENGTHFWQRETSYFAYYSVLDSNGNIQFVYSNIAAGTYTTGIAYPRWAPASATTPQPTTADGNIIWKNVGKPGIWVANATTTYYECIVDSNYNLQLCTTPGTSGATPPAWATSAGSGTTDNTAVWVCLGTGVTLTTDSIQYAFSLHAVDGSVSTASPAYTIYGGILGPPAAKAPYIQIGGSFTPDQQIDKINIWRSPQGQLGTLLLEDQIPVDSFSSGTFTYNDYGVPDTSINGSGSLDAFIQAPTASAGNPPPAGFMGPVYHLQRVWGFVGNVLYYSTGPDAVVSASNGNTAFPSLNSIIYQAQIVKLWPITVQNGGLLVFTTSGIFIVLGTGTTTNPFYSTQFCTKINLASYDTFDVLGTEIFLMEANAKVSSLQIEYPFNPQSGYTEIGFPIGDQFKTTTTGGFNSALFNPATSYLSWNVQSSGETAMYVADGNGHWFRLSAIVSPESGLIWHPIASITGGSSAIQSVETAPGVFDLLIGPGFSGPILKRDTTGTVWADNGTTYPAWDAKGVNLLCSTGQWAEVAHISAKSTAVGARPIVSVLLGEIAPSTQRPWNVLQVTSPDPPDTPRSVSVFSDRYALAQNGVADTGDCILTKFDYGAQAYADELLDWGIYATTDDERKEEVQKG